jgi:hypothetical protein
MRSNRSARLAVTLLLAGSAGPAAAGALSPYGVNVHAPEGTEQTVIYGAVKEASIGWVRIDFSWSDAEPAKGVFDWRSSDAVVAGAAARGLQVFATIVGTPAWATAGDPGRGVPRSAADWADFCYRAAARYGDTVHVWGIWNESNRPEAFAGTRQEYLNVLLIPGADAIHAASPGALVAGPETAHTVSSNSNWYRWLQDTIQQAGDRVDVVTHHVYDSGSDAGVTKKLNASTAFGGNPDLWDVVNPSVREVLQRTGWFGRPFWLTETGWAADQVGEASQAAYTAGLLGTWFGASAPNHWVGRVFFYEIKDDGNPAVPRWGLLRTDGSRRPSWAAYRDFIAANPPAGDDADVVAETVPETMATGSTADVTVRLRNGGSTTWSGRAGYKLSAEGDAAVLGPGRVLLPSESIPPGGEALFSFRLNAEVPPGGYRTSWRMLKEGSGPFGTSVSKGVTVAGACPAPGAPAPYAGPSAPVQSGSTLVFSWSDPSSGTTRPASYRYELSPAASFTNPSVSGSTSGNTFAFVTERGAGMDLSFRVRGVSGCGQAGPWSESVGARVAGSPGPFLVTGTEGLPMLARTGGTPATALIRYRNAGPVAAFLRLSPSGSLFVLSAASLLVPSGQEVNVTVAAAPGSSAAQGLFRETLTASWDSGSVTTELFLAVTDLGTAGHIAADRTSVRIVTPVGGTGEASLSVANSSPFPLALTANVSPGGAWLRFDTADLARPLAPGETRQVRLTADRTRWNSGDVPSPARTVLTLIPAGGTEADAVAVSVLHVEAPPSQTGGRPPVTAGGSFFLPTAVHAAGALEQLFTSYGWIRNLGPDAALVDLYAVRQGADGRSAARVTQAIPGYTALPLVDFIQTLFGADSLPAAVEIRSASPAALAVRTTARGERTGGTSYETEIPVMAAGAATGGGDAPLVLAGVKSTSNFRMNVILAETSGSPVRVVLRLLAWTGTELATAVADVPPLGSVQFPLAETMGVTNFEAATLFVEPLSGSGRVTVIGTVIDNASASFSVATGVPSSPRPAGALVIPSIVHARGNGSYFTTDLSISNVTLAPVTLRLVYAYAGTDALGAAVSGETAKEVTIAARGALPIGDGNDVIRRLFFFSPDSNTSGTLRIEGATSSIAVRAVVSTPVDLLDGTKGTKSAEFGAFAAASPEVVGPGATGFVLYPGLEKSDSERVNLILTEVAGGNATVRVRLLSAVEAGLLGERSFSLAPYQKVQVNDLWNGADGFALGAFPMDRVMVTLEGTGGTGRVVGALTPVTNSSNSPRVLMLAPPGPPAPSR